MKVNFGRFYPHLMHFCATLCSSLGRAEFVSSACLSTWWALPSGWQWQPLNPALLPPSRPAESYRLAGEGKGGEGAPHYPPAGIVMGARDISSLLAPPGLESDQPSWVHCRGEGVSLSCLLHLLPGSQKQGEMPWPHSEPSQAAAPPSPWVTVGRYTTSPFLPPSQAAILSWPVGGGGAGMKGRAQGQGWLQWP